MNQTADNIEIIVYESQVEYTDQRDLQRFNRLYEKHKHKSTQIKRYFVQRDKDIIKQNEDLSRLIYCAGVDILTATYVNGKIVKIEYYPTQKEVRDWISNT